MSFGRGSKGYRGSNAMMEVKKDSGDEEGLLCVW